MRRVRVHVGRGVRERRCSAQLHCEHAGVCPCTSEHDHHDQGRHGVDEGNGYQKDKRRRLQRVLRQLLAPREVSYRGELLVEYKRSGG